MKTCVDCKEDKPLAEFYQRTSKGKRAGQLQPYCKACHGIREARMSLARKLAVYERLGGKCFCCGETELGFLGIDHKNDDGAAHRREIGRSGKLYKWLYGRPEEDHRFQIACHNCNIGRHFNGGVCPHQLDLGATGTE